MSHRRLSVKNLKFKRSLRLKSPQISQIRLHLVLKLLLIGVFHKQLENHTSAKLQQVKTGRVACIQIPKLNLANKIWLNQTSHQTTLLNKLNNSKTSMSNLNTRPNLNASAAKSSNRAANSTSMNMAISLVSKGL
jgi:hypothetical protein